MQEPIMENWEKIDTYINSIDDTIVKNSSFMPIKETVVVFEWTDLIIDNSWNITFKLNIFFAFSLFKALNTQIIIFACFVLSTLANFFTNALKRFLCFFGTNFPNNSFSKAIFSSSKYFAVTTHLPVRFQIGVQVKRVKFLPIPELRISTFEGLIS